MWLEVPWKMNRNSSSKKPDKLPNKKKILLGLRIFIGLSVLTVTVLLLFTASRDTWKALKQVNILYLPAIIGLLFSYIILEATRIRIIIYSIKSKWIPLHYTMKVIFCGAFMSAVTPFQAGGFPLQAYILTRAGLKWGDALLTLLLRAVFYATGLVVLFPLILPYFKMAYEGTSMQILSRYAIFAYVFLIGILALVLFYPRPLKKFLYGLSMRKGKKTKFTRVFFKAFREIRRMRKGFFSFVKEKKVYSIFILLLTLIVYLPNYSIAWLILKGLSIDVPFVDALLRQIFLLFAAFFFPTPGAGGIIEGGFTALFFNAVPKHLIGIFAILWRFFTYHLVVIIGGFLTLRVLHLEEAVSEIASSKD